MDEGIVLTITLDAQGQLQMHGPIGNKVLCLGMLELAKKLVFEYKEGNNLVIPKLVIPKGMSS